ncbi:acyl carrier protein [Kitasatospora sp. SUK 42]|uniref:acyl carrier protein n=1 Tax=Kitasatospora sp. SUK 42 TaxID=1588882 RepID=UPI0018CA42E2|nr:acyl carrier protein [Kitasatospora sp. SUK 42]MBV2156639.1 acyl carrier protein [Kitasatospora sp. SUK 42]
MNAIEERIAEVLSAQFKVERAAIEPDVTFAALRFDSLVLIELGLILDTEFGVEIDDGELTNEMTISDAAELVAAKGASL